MENSKGKEEIYQEIYKRNLPDFMIKNGKRIMTEEEWKQQKEEITDMIFRELYGYQPFRDCTVTGWTERRNEDALGGKAYSELIYIKTATKYGVYIFPFTLLVPKGIKKVPLFIRFSFGMGEDMTEEILDHGFAIASVFYQNIMPDRLEAIREGIAGVGDPSAVFHWGKISMWAYGISRMTDYLLTRQDIDADRIALVGHSRRGKSVLLCGAIDHRYSLIVSAGSGAGGAALFRGKKGEQIENLSQHWFCENRKKYDFHPELLPFDQHYLIALAAPARVYISSASRDDWADPKSEFLSCVAASPAYEFQGIEGLIFEGWPECDCPMQEGHIAYHVRTGTHHLGRADWLYYMEYRDRYHI